jgi:hypothetical protein
MPRGLHCEGVYQLEDGMPADVVEGLKKLGYKTTSVVAPLGPRRRSGLTETRACSPAVPIRARTAARSATKRYRGTPINFGVDAALRFICVHCAGISAIANATIGAVVLGRTHVLPIIVEFQHTFPDIRIRMQLTDRSVSLLEEHVDVAVHVGDLRQQHDCDACRAHSPGPLCQSC